MGPAASGPALPTSPGYWEGCRVHTTTYFLGGSCRQSVIEPQTEQAHFTYHKSSPTFLSKKCEGMLNTQLPPRHIRPLGTHWGARAAACTPHSPSRRALSARFPRSPLLPAGSQLTPCRSPLSGTPLQQPAGGPGSTSPSAQLWGDLPERFRAAARSRRGPALPQLS